MQTSLKDTFSLKKKKKKYRILFCILLNRNKKRFSNTKTDSILFDHVRVHESLYSE